jgi:acetoacetyl-CoA reductase/3-oxoacyl-[acyl-carrier protein] reductase
VASWDLAPPEGDAPQHLLEVVCDVTSVGSVKEAMRRTLDRFEGLDGVVQSAGITRDGVLWKMSDGDWEQVLEVNLTGAFHVLREATPHLRARGGGAIVNVTSINGFRGKFGQSNYAASKAGLVALTKTAARELGAFGIRVNAVAPGLVQTAMTAQLPPAVVERALEESALKRVTEPEDVAHAVLFLLSDGARQITGTTLRVDAGQCM